jgi:hypothetical protein
MQEWGFGLTNDLSGLELAYRLVYKQGATDRFNREKKATEAGFRKSGIRLFNRDAIRSERVALYSFQ